ncbi:type II toxin-antitoxin system PemK/MazF family toxin, partial [Campylobacter jejuni]|nr:type II toxin-antitoxin system PemK/MazF family toxin [Campylobacter jejuni]
MQNEDLKFDEWNEVKKHIEKEKNKIVKKQKIY